MTVPFSMLLATLAGLAMCSALDPGVEKITNQYYLQLVQQLGGNNVPLQVVVTPSVWNDNSYLAYADEVPVKAASTNSSATLGSFRTFNSEYRSMLESLHTSSIDLLSNILDVDQYAEYQKCYIKGIVDQGKKMQESCKYCAQMYPGIVNKILGVCGQLGEDFVIRALDKVKVSECYFQVENGTRPKYTPTWQEVGNAITQGTSKSFSWDTTTASTDISHTWSSGGTSGFWSWFGIGAGGAYDKYSKQVTNSAMTVSFKFEHLAQIPVRPGCWFDSAALSAAINKKDNTMWTPGASRDWNSLFGTDGSLVRHTGALVVADGIEMTVTANTEIAKNDMESVKAAAAAGFWPFFYVGAKTERDGSRVTFDGGKVTFTMNSPAGNPHLIGRTVIPTADIVPRLRTLAMSHGPPGLAPARNTGDTMVVKIRELARSTNSDYLKHALHRVATEYTQLLADVRKAGDDFA